VFFFLLWQQHCSVICFTSLWVKWLSFHEVRLAKENSSYVSNFKCLYPFKKHLNILLLLNIGFYSLIIYSVLFYYNENMSQENVSFSGSHFNYVKPTFFMAEEHHIRNSDIMKAIRDVHSFIQEETLKIKSNHPLVLHKVIVVCVSVCVCGRARACLKFSLNTIR
jgi:hypothetical protein